MELDVLPVRAAAQADLAREQVELVQMPETTVALAVVLEAEVLRWYIMVEHPFLPLPAVAAEVAEETIARAPTAAAATRPAALADLGVLAQWELQDL